MSNVTNVSEADVVPGNNSSLNSTSILGSGLVSTADDSFRNLTSFLAKWWDDLGAVNTVGGTANAITVTTPTLYATLKTGIRIQFIASAANTTATTINVDSLGVLAVRKISGGTDVALVAGDIAGAAVRCEIVYSATANSSAGGWILLNPAVTSGLTAAANSDALAATSTTLAVTPANLAAERLLHVVSDNIGFSASVGSSALTITLLGANGSAVSATNPVTIPFRNTTAGTGTPSNLTITSATTMVISSGSTMGFANGVIGRLWIVGFNDAGTFRLGLVNTLSGVSIMALRNGIYSSTAEGGAGAADSAQVIYTGTAVTSKPMTILGYLEATEATAGTWATAPSLLKIYQPGDAQPGEMIQQVYPTPVTTVQTGTTTIPLDDTIPQNTEGTQFLTASISPYGAANLLRVQVVIQASNSANAVVGSAIFRDSGANAVDAIFYNPASTNTSDHLAHDYWVLAASTATTTFNNRVGSSGTAGTITINGIGGVREYGGSVNSVLYISEYKA